MMRRLRLLSPEASIRRLRQTIQANTIRSREIEKVLRQHARIFDSLSDCVFIFCNEVLVRANHPARQFLESAANSEELLRKIRDARPGPAPSSSDWINGSGPKSESLLLKVRSSFPIHQREGPSRLIVAEDLSWILAEEATFRQRFGHERKQIASDLHDGLSQILTFLSFQAKSLENRAKGSEAEKRFSEIRSLAQECAGAAAAIIREFDSESYANDDFLHQIGDLPR